MKLLGTTKSKTNKDKNAKNVSHLEITEVVLVHSNILNNNCQKNLRVLCAFLSNKLFGQLLDISSKSFTFLKTFTSEFYRSKLWPTKGRRSVKHYFIY